MTNIRTEPAKRACPNTESDEWGRRLFHSTHCWRTLNRHSSEESTSGWCTFQVRSVQKFRSYKTKYHHRINPKNGRWSVDLFFLTINHKPTETNR